MMKLNFHSDPGHGWLEVPYHLLNKFGILGEISECSYISSDKSKVYLEEDCDASVFIEAAKKLGKIVEFNEINYNDRCFIRHCLKFSV